MANSMQAAQIRILMACLVKGGFKRKLFRGDFLSENDRNTVLSSSGFSLHSKFIITIVPSLFNAGCKEVVKDI